MIRNKFIVIATLGLPLLFLSLRNTSGSDESCGGDGARKSAGPPACYAGEPPNNTTCQTSGCHTDFTLNSGTAFLTLDLGGAESGYTPGESYIIKISLYKPGLTRGGFQCTALRDNNDTISPGVFTLTNIIRTQIIDKLHPHAHDCEINSKVWIEHTDGGIDDVSNDSLSWEFGWQAPADDVGNITFYLAANEANADLDNTGDYIYSISKKSLSPTTGVDEPDEYNISLFPNPAGDFLHLQFSEAIRGNADNRITITDLAGKVMLKSKLVHTIPVEDLPQGKYIVNVDFNGGRKAVSFVKMK